MKNIDWTNISFHLSAHFTVRDALWLPKWNRLANDADGLTLEIKANLILLFDKMETVREFLGNQPINVHVTYRPKLYNKLVKGATNSAHIYGKACDFDVEGLDCDTVRSLIVPKLEVWGLRCEKVKGANWAHIDTREPGSGNRYFIP
jgi:uncharacterized protein YcbK (DUF882 family)